MSAEELLRASRLKEAIAALLNEVRNNPADHRRRTFLFELLCFAGELERAGKHLEVLADESPDAGVGALLYRSALSAYVKRESFFEQGKLPENASAVPRPGILNGQPFDTIEDCDSRIGPRLEVFIAGECVWLPFAHIGSFQMPPPRFLRDTLWPSAQVFAGPALQGKEFGEVIVPVLYPFSWKHPSDAVKLGRETVWDDAGVPYGQKLLLLDGEREVPYLEIRDLKFRDSEIVEAPLMMAAPASPNT
jgi:type VI secretion system protein ImpE